MTDLTTTQIKAADWLEKHWLAVVGGGPLTKQLRERFDLEFQAAIQVIVEVCRRRGQ